MCVPCICDGIGLLNGGMFMLLCNHQGFSSRCLSQSGVENLVLVRCPVCLIPFEQLPRGLQHHDGVLSFVGARRGELDVNIRQAAAARVAVAATGHAAHLDGRVCRPSSEGLQTRRQGMELEI